MRWLLVILKIETSTGTGITVITNPLLLRSGLQILTSRVTLSSKGEATEEEVSPASIKDAGVIFTPGSRIQETMDSVKFQKIQVQVFLL